ncbi:hypothetical protein AU194_27460 [Mycobacterium sp. GA-2829]|nr:hypothetical protein AU194_27460 [Mycobacterium sp. GA-2829]
MLAIAWSVTLSSAVSLLAATVLVMGGTQHPLVSAQGGWADPYPFVADYADDAVRIYVVPSAAVRGDATEPDDYQAVAVHTPEEFSPVFGTTTFGDSVDAGLANLGDCVSRKASCVSRPVQADPDAQLPPAEFESPFVIYGYSQSAIIATLLKRQLIEQYGDSEDLPDIDFVLLANPNRPNGGIMQRFEGLSIPLLNVTFNGSTPTNGGFDTVDVARQYDGWADFPVYPMNMLATMNALMGIYYLHGDYWSTGVAAPLEQAEVGDTTYYMIPTDRLPLLTPLAQLGVPSPLLTALDAPLRVIVEWGYDRDADHVGTPTRAGLFPVANPITGLTNLVIAIPTGLDDAAAESAGDPTYRPLGTKPVESPYGVGGIELGDPLPPPAAPETQSINATETTPVVETPPAETPDNEPKSDAKRQVAETGDDGDVAVKPQRRGPISRILDRLKPQRHESPKSTEPQDPGKADDETEDADDPAPEDDSADAA